MTNYQNVHARAMLVTLNISTWAARRFDKKVTKDAQAANDATDESGRYNKHLLAGASEHAKVYNTAGSARAEHFRQTLPWTDEGWRLLPTANFVKYSTAMRLARAEFDRALDVFIDVYPLLCVEAEAKLGKSFNANEYPTAASLRRRYAWAIEFMPVPASGDLRVELPGDQILQIEQRITERVETATKQAMQDAWQRLHEAVARVKKAAGPEGVVRGNLIEHVRETVDVLGRLNVAEDRQLDAMIARVERELATVAPDDLRKDEALRASVERDASAIMTAMSAFYAPQQEDAA